MAETALAEALDTGNLSRVGLDVFGEEPICGAHPLCHFGNAVLMHHFVSATSDRRRRGMDVVEEALAVLGARQPRYRIV